MLSGSAQPLQQVHCKPVLVLADSHPKNRQTNGGKTIIIIIRSESHRLHPRVNDYPLYTIHKQIEYETNVGQFNALSVSVCARDELGNRFCL